MKNMRLWLSLVALLLSTGWSAAVAAEMDCGPIAKPGGFGPFDYRDPANRTKNLPLVEAYHFTPKVENLVGGESGNSIGSDLSYTLHAFPNHHRALNALIRFSQRQKSNHPAGSKYSVECWFDRAIRFKDNDGTVRMLFGNYLTQRAKYDEAMIQYQEAERLLPDSPNVAYNFGLLHFERKDYDKALQYAKKAYAKGFPLDGLRNKLIRVGKWN